MSTGPDLLLKRLERLRERIEWMRGELAKRAELHRDLEAEIHSDVQQLSRRVAHMTIPEIRQRLDDELRKLKKDRRNNATRAWKDALELTDRLLELTDRYEALAAIKGASGRAGERREIER